MTAITKTMYTFVHVLDEEEGGVHVFRACVPHGEPLDPRTGLQTASVRLAEGKVASFILLLHRAKPYAELAYRVLSAEISEALDSIVDDDDDDEEEDEEDEEADFDDEDKPARAPEPKKAKTTTDNDKEERADVYVMPTVTRLTADVFSEKMIRDARSAPYKLKDGEHHVTVVFMLDADDTTN
jgi:hypothetical protein